MVMQSPFQRSKTVHMGWPGTLIQVQDARRTTRSRLESTKFFWNFGTARAHGVFTHNRCDKVPNHTAVNDSMLSGQCRFDPAH